MYNVYAKYTHDCSYVKAMMLLLEKEARSSSHSSFYDTIQDIENNTKVLIMHVHVCTCIHTGFHTFTILLYILMLHNSTQ